MENKAIDIILSRRSVRSYKPDKLTKEQLDTLIEAALISPTAMNLQHWHFTFILNKEILDELEGEIVEYIMETGDEALKERFKSRQNKVMYDAPCLAVISADKGKYSQIDAGIAVQSLALAAKALDLDSVILGMTGLALAGAKKDYWAKKLKIPEGYEFAISIAIGHGNLPGNERKTDPSKATIIQ